MPATILHEIINRDDLGSYEVSLTRIPYLVAYSYIYLFDIYSIYRLGTYHTGTPVPVPVLLYSTVGIFFKQLFTSYRK